MRESSACLDPEVLAAFIDGRLTEVERRRVVEHLDACEDCYAVFSETVRFQGEEEPRGRVVRSERFGSRQWVWAAAAAAAVLVVLVAVPVLRLSPSQPVMVRLPDGSEVVVSAEELVARIGPPEPGGSAEAAPWPAWPGEEGLGFAGTGLTPEKAAFRVGARLVDLRMAARDGDGEAAREALSGLARTFEAAGLAAKLRKPLAGASDAASEGRLGDLGGAAAGLERSAGRFLDPRFLAFGEWAEAGRLAASVGDRTLFASPVFAAFLDEMSSEELPEGVAERMAAIRERMHPDRGGPEPADMDELRRLFGKLMTEPL